METKFYRYRPNIQFERIAGICMGAFLVIWQAIALLALLFGRVGSLNNAWAFIVLPILGELWCVYLINQHPDIGINKDGLLIQSLWRYLPVTWDDIGIITEHWEPNIPTSWGDIFKRREPLRSFWVISAEPLTMFHEMYGWIYSGKGQRSFIVHSMLNGHREIIDEIERHVFAEESATVEADS